MRERVRRPVTWYWAFSAAMGIAGGLAVVVCFVLSGITGQPTLGAVVGFLLIALAVYPSLRFARYMTSGLWPPN